MPEREIELPSQEGIQARPEFPDVSQSMQKVGISVSPTQFTAQVTSNQGQPLIETSAVEIPADISTLESLKKGNASLSSTWWANFWLRIKNVASFLGRRVVVSNANAS